jgi:hypothetical protein
MEAQAARRPGGPAVPVGRVLALVGAVVLVAAYAMPWLSVQVAPGQGITLSGLFLGRFLSGTDDLRRFMPGARGGAAEVQQLRALVLLFPACGALAGLVALATAFMARRLVANVVLALLGLVPLVALVVGLGQLPAGAGAELGLWVIGAGAAGVLLGAVLDAGLARARA